MTGQGILNLPRLRHLEGMGVLTPLDLHFAAFLCRFERTPEEGMPLAAALTSQTTREGHICLDLMKIAGKPLEGCTLEDPLYYPRCDTWTEGLRVWPPVGSPGEVRPLILDQGNRLYLYRYWKYETLLAEAMAHRALRTLPAVDPAPLEEALNGLFPRAGAGEDLDLQKVAAWTASRKALTILSGGPGTGKTTTVARILALWALASQGKALRVALAAPTGKAAARLKEAIQRAKQGLSCTQAVKEAIPEEASTLHRLLGTIPGSPYFRYNQKNRLPIDAVIVDEASMVDLSLMCKLVQALPDTARLLLLGDKDQLSSVESGAVLGDLCAGTGRTGYGPDTCRAWSRVSVNPLPVTAAEGNPLRDCIVVLEKNYRFGADSGIGALSLAVNRGDAEEALRILREGGRQDLRWIPMEPEIGSSPTLRDRVTRGYGPYLGGEGAGEVLSRFDGFRILCALRKGPFGAVILAQWVEGVLREAGVLRPGRLWYPFRPVMVTVNDYALGLFNGDTGIALRDPEAAGELRVFFKARDGRFRAFSPLRLPEHETAFATTIHKSQGSEFDGVLMILPDRDSPVLTRELLYTGITRARRGLAILGTERIFRLAVSRRISRNSGLRDALWGAGAESQGFFVDNDGKQD